MLNMFRMLKHPSSGACDLFVELFHGLYCSGSMCVGVTLWFDCGGVVSVCRLQPAYRYHNTPQPYHNVTPTHIEPEQYNPWNNSTNKSQAPEAGCINIRNILSIKQWNNKASDIKRSAIFWYVTQRRMVISYRRFETIYRFLEDGTDRLPN